MNAKTAILMTAVALLVSSFNVAAELSPMEALGEFIFFDESLSINRNQSCASCHGPEAGWTGPLEKTNESGAVYEGSIPVRFGDRKPPSAAYATLSPVFHQDKSGLFIGGNFWDGRATGEVLGNPSADQALGPFLNPAEQALPDSACVVYQVCKTYEELFEEVSYTGSCDIDWPDEEDVKAVCENEGGTMSLSDDDRAKSDGNYGFIGLSLAAYEASSEVNAFSSKFDLTKLGKQERRGLALFRGKGKCSRCHTANGKEPLFSDFTFDNLGLPQNPDNPAGTAPDFVDPGLGGFLKSEGYDEEVYDEEWGKHKVPTLRNVGKGSCEDELSGPGCIIKAYGHNGYFKSLAGIVHFYNTRDVKSTCSELLTDLEAREADCWPEPEVSENVNDEELGDLGLSPKEEEAIVAFLMTLSDGHVPAD